MTHGARTDLALGSVTCVASRVSLDADRYRLARSRRFMTRRASFRRTTFARHVRRVHELHVESLDKLCRENFHRRRGRVHVLVTDRAHRLLFGIRELTDVATDARIVTGKLESGRFTFASMTRRALELFVLGDAVRESPERFVRRADGDALRSFRCGDRHRSFRRAFDTRRGENRECG